MSVLIGHAQAEAVQMTHGAFNRLPFSWGAGVDVFFVISGFVMIYTSEKFWGAANGSLEFARRRLTRVVPVYWLYTTFMLMALILVPSQLDSARLEWDNAILSYLFIPDARLDGKVRPLLILGWTLNYEMFFYALFAVVLFFKRRLGVILLLGLLATLVGLGVLVPGLPEPMKTWTNPIILEFGFGVLLGLAFLKNPQRPSLLVGALMTFVAGLLYAKLYPGLDGHPQLRWLALGVPAAVLFYLVVWSFREAPPRWVEKIATTIGDSSYSLYLSHPFSLALLKLVWPFPSSNPHYAWLYVVCACIVAICGGIASFNLIERPVQRWFDSRRRSRLAAA